MILLVSSGRRTRPNPVVIEGVGFFVSFFTRQRIYVVSALDITGSSLQFHGVRAIP